MERLLLDLSINVTSMFRDPTFYARVPREGRAGAAHVSVHAHLGRRLLDGRGGLLARDPPARRKGSTTGRASTRPTSTRRCSSARATASSRSTRCRSTRRTTSARAASSRSPSTTSRSYEGALFDRALTENVVWAPHNLVQDRAFNTFNVILCRNVMIYFDRALQTPRAPALLRQPRAVRDPRARPQGVDPVHRVRGRATRSSTRTRSSTGRCDERAAADTISWRSARRGAASTRSATILRGLPAELDAAVVVAQHRSPESHPTAFRDLLGAATACTSCEAGDKDELQPGTVYIAAPDYHLLVERRLVALSTDEPVLYARPSIDVLLETRRRVVPRALRRRRPHRRERRRRARPGARRASSAAPRSSRTRRRRSATRCRARRSRRCPSRASPGRGDRASARRAVRLAKSAGLMRSRCSSSTTARRTCSRCEAILEPLGHELVTAASGAEALRILLQRDDFAVILLDVQMPEHGRLRGRRGDQAARAHAARSRSSS